MKKVYLTDYGCPDRKIDSATLSRHLEKNDYEVTDRIKDADVVIVSTCAHVFYNEEKSIFDINQALKRKKKTAKVIVSGCLPKINPKRMNSFFKGNTVSPVNLEDINKILNLKDKNIILEKEIKEEPISIRKIKRFFDFYSLSGILKAAPQIPVFIKMFFGKEKNKEAVKKKRYYINTGKGCSISCSFCAIKLVHGSLKSEPIKKIEAEFREGLKEGYNEFMILNKDISEYGIDIGTNIGELCDRLLSQKGNFTVNFTSGFNPRGFINNVEKLSFSFEKNKKKIKEIGISVQSGSEKILRMMGRGNYSLEKLKDAVRYLNKNVPSLKLVGTIMVGFPGESEEDHKKTLEFVKSCAFDEVQIWRYDEKENTKAAMIKEKVPEKIIQKRVKKSISFFKSVDVPAFLANPKRNFY